MLSNAIFEIFGAPFELMKFELLFDGNLVSSGNHHRHVEEKWEIRKAIEPQLKELWDTHPALAGIGLYSKPPSFSMPSISMADDIDSIGRKVKRVLEKPHEIRIQARYETEYRLRKPILVGGKEFLPLVRNDLALGCKLNITFLRKGEPGELILPGGDIDNRMKTLFDALSIPSEQDLRGNPDHEPFFCSLQNDSLIIEQHIKTGRLLRAPSSSPSAAHLLIEVSVNVMRITESNIGFIGD